MLKNQFLLDGARIISFHVNKTTVGYSGTNTPMLEYTGGVSVQFNLTSIQLYFYLNLCTMYTGHCMSYIGVSFGGYNYRWNLMLRLVHLICRLASLWHNYVILNITSGLQSFHVSGYA